MYTERGQKLVFDGSHGRVFDPATTASEHRHLFAAGGFVDAASFLRAHTKALKKERNGRWELVLVLADTLPQWLQDAPLNAHVQIGITPLAVDEDDDTDTERRIRQAMILAGQLPDDPDFQEWLRARYDRWRLIQNAMGTDSDQVGAAALETLKRLVGVPSRADLKLDLDAVARMEAFAREFYADTAAKEGLFAPHNPKF